MNTNSWLISFNLPGTGCALVYVASTDAVVRLFTVKSISQVMVFLAISLNVGEAIYILVYNFFFTGNGTPFDQDLSRYFSLLAASTLVLHIVVYIIYKLHDATPVLVKDDYEIMQSTHKEEESEKRDEKEISNNVQHNCSVPKPVPDQKDSKWKNVKSMFFSRKFHLLFWPAVTVTCLRLVCVVNLDTYLLSFQIDHYPQIIFYISPMVSICMKLTMSAVFYLFSDRVPRVGLITAGAFLSLVSFILALYQMQNVNVIMLLLIMWTLAGGLGLSLVPAIFADQFGKETSAISLGAIHAAKATIQFTLQGLLGGLYDIQITDGGRTCYGADCFNIFFITGATLSGLCLILLMSYMYLQRITKSEER